MKPSTFLRKAARFALIHTPLLGKLYQRRVTLGRRWPRIINIEITSKCNARCTYCGRDALMGEGVRRPRNMAPELFEKIVCEIASLPQHPERIVPVGLGDPFLYPHLEQVLTLLAEYLPENMLQLTSNAIHFPERLMDLLITTRLDKLVLSVNYHDRDSYRQFNGVDKFQVVVDNVARFLALKGAHKPDVTIQILDIDRNQTKIDDFKRFWRQRINANDRLLIRPFNDFGGTIDATRFVADFSPGSRFPCKQLFDHLMINVDGYCFPCCMGITAANDDLLTIGNVERQSLQEVFASGGRLGEIRQAHLRDDYHEIPKCRNCGTWSEDVNIFFRHGGRWR